MAAPDSLKRTSLAEQSLSDFLDWIGTTYSSRPALLYRRGLKTDVWTYEDLRQQAQRVANWLQDQGVAKGDRVVLWASNSPWWVASFFGILRAGAVLVPLDARSSPDFVERVVNQSEPRLAIAARASTRAWTFEIPIFAIEDLDQLLPNSVPSDGMPAIEPDDLAEIIFTSGTTGAPKGVMLTHRNIRSNVEAINEVFPSGPRFKPLSILPLSHLLEQTVGLLLALRGGTSIAYATALQPAAIQRDMAEYRVTTMVLVPRILSLFMSSIEESVKRSNRERIWNRARAIAAHLPRPARRILFRRVIRSFGGRLDFLVTGGGPLEPELERKWELMGIAVLQGYGSTETSPIITATALKDRKPRSVGKALPGTEVTLAADGEIYVKGPNVMEGYWKNPQATSEVLVDGYYHTGDLGELDSEGRLYLKGRKKDMIVLENGMNVFPEDVEEAVRRAPGVAEAVVLGVPSSYGLQIHAVLLCDSPEAKPEAILAEANKQLASHQQIRSYHIWPEPDFPRTHTAKIKRPEVAKWVSAQTADDTPPSPPQESQKSSKKPSLAKVVADVVGKPADEVTAKTKLEDLGLDAVGLIQLERSVEDRLGKFLREDSVAADTTVGELEPLLTSENLAGENLYPLWPFSRIMRIARSLAQWPLFTAIGTINKPHTAGLENVLGLDLPAIFVADYESYLVAPFILYALPKAIRQRVGISTSWKIAATEGRATPPARKQPLAATLVALFFNSFRYQPSGSLHTALVHASGLLDHDWSILFLRRGSNADTRRISQGIGALAEQFRVPVIPVHVSGLRRPMPLAPIPARKSLTVKFGEAITCDPGMSYHDLEACLEDAMAHD